MPTFDELKAAHALYRQEVDAALDPLLPLVAFARSRLKKHCFYCGIGLTQHANAGTFDPTRNGRQPRRAQRGIRLQAMQQRKSCHDVRRVPRDAVLRQACRVLR
jgi:hypothetical protein